MVERSVSMIQQHGGGGTIYSTIGENGIGC